MASGTPFISTIVWARPKISSGFVGEGRGGAGALPRCPSASASAAEYATSPSRNTRSQGTNTSSKSTVQSGMLRSRLIGKCRGSSARGAVVMLMILSPGVSTGTAQAIGPVGVRLRHAAGGDDAQLVHDRRAEDVPLRALQDDAVLRAAHDAQLATVLDRGGNTEVVFPAAPEEPLEPVAVGGSASAEARGHVAQRHAAGGARCGDVRLDEEVHLLVELPESPADRTSGCGPPAARVYRS